jgi:hypothetical protein
MTSFGILILFAFGEENFGRAELFWFPAPRAGLPNNKDGQRFALPV